MAVVNQKKRYRRQAWRCYKIAAMMTGERAISMIRLGDTYAALAVDPERRLPSVFASQKEVNPICRRCERRMQLTYSLPRTKTMPPMQEFRCDACWETLIWKGKTLPSRPARQSRGTVFAKKDEWITRYLVVSFRRVGSDFVPGPSVECPDASLAIHRAGLMTRDTEIVGSIALSRRGNPDTQEYEPAIIHQKFGEIPPDFDIA